MRSQLLAVLAAFGLAVCSNSAIAADVSADRTTNWDGFYVGVNGGYAGGEFTNYDKASKNCWWCADNYGSDIDGVFGGGTAGFNFTTGQFLLGAEAEIGFGSIDGTAKDRQSSVPKTEVDINSYGTVAARAGVFFDSFLLYGKAGWGFMNADIDWKDTTYGGKASSDEFMSTFVYGGGVEYAFNDSVSMKLEYLRFQLDDTNTLNVKGYCCGYQQHVGIDAVNTVKLGLNYHF